MRFWMITTAVLLTLTAMGPTANAEWTAKPDPGLNSAIPASSRIDVVLGKRYLLPKSRGFHVLIAPEDSSDEPWVLTDIRTGQEVGRVPHHLVSSGRPVLSSNGRYLMVPAGTTRRTRLPRGSAGPAAPQKALSIYDARTGRLVRTITGPEGFRPTSFDVLADGKIAAWHHGNMLGVFDIATGRLVWSQKELKSWNNAFTVSPGRRYLAWSYPLSGRGTGLTVRDAATGKEVGSLTLHHEKGRSRPDCRALQFSRDGSHLAGAFEVSSVGHLIVCWDVATGAETNRIFLRRSICDKAQQKRSFRRQIRSRRQLEWLDDNAGWLLFGTMVVDRKLGTTIHSLMPPPNLRETLPWCVLDDEHILCIADNTLGKIQRTDQDRLQRLISAAIPVCALERAAAAVNSGTSFSEAGPAELMAGDFGSMANWDPAASARSPWVYKPTPKLATAIESEWAAVLPIDRHHLAAWLARGTTTTVLASYRLECASEQPEDGGNYWIDFRKPKLVDLDFVGGAQALAISDDGRFGLFHRQTDRGPRLDIYEMKNAIHLAGWIPCGPDQAKSFRITAGRFVAEGKVLVWDGGGYVTLWEPTWAKAIARWRHAGTDRAVLCPKGKYLFDCDRMNFVDLATGKSVGRLRAPSGSKAAAAGFRDYGFRFATVAPSGTQSALTLWDLATGRAGRSMTVRQPPKRLVCAGWKWIFLGSEVFDIKSGRGVWDYTGCSDASMPAGEYYSAGLGLQAIIADADADADNGSTTVWVRRLPNNEEVQKIDKHARFRKMEALLRPGARVSIKLGGSVPKEMIEAARKSLTSRLDREGFTVADGEPIVLTIEVNVKNTGTRRYYGSMRGAEYRLVRIKRADYFREWNLRGKVIYRDKGQLANTDERLVHLKKNQSLQEGLDEKMWDVVKSKLCGSGVPTKVWPGVEEAGSTTASVTERAKNTRTLTVQPRRGKPTAVRRPVGWRRSAPATPKPSATPDTADPKPAPATIESIVAKLNQPPKVDRDGLAELEKSESK